MTDERLLDHITAARWFGGKGRSARLLDVTPLPWLRPPGDWPAVRQEIAEIGYADSDDHDFYQLLISYRPQSAEDGSVITEIVDPQHGTLAGTDGAEDPAAHDALLGFVLTPSTGSGVPSTGSGVPSTGSGSLIAHQVSVDQLSSGLPSRVFGGEQSNTSIVFAHLAIMKLFRRIEIGRNLDIETHDVLTRSGNPDVPRLYGWIEGSWSGADDGIDYGADLAMITELLPEARDGWEYALAELRAGHDFAAQAGRLGMALAGVHAALRTSFPTATVDGEQVAAIMNDRLSAAITAVPQLQAYADGLRSVFGSLEGRQLPTQRVHGDFHLGQTLHTPLGWKIIDFEGEPARSLAERSRPDSTWRDIAGALRSFDYAAAHVPDRSSADWAAACTRSFLDGYRAAVPGADDDLDDDLNDDTALHAYIADKAVYEVVYESRNRPDWVDIPLTAVAAIARSQHGE